MSRRPAFRRPAVAAQGFTLIELMVAMLLGLIVIGGVVSVFIANQRTYRTNQALGDVQDGSRTAFEMMARDIRDAGLTGCTNNGRVSNVLNNRTTAWWANWSNTLVGYDHTQTDAAVAIGTAEKARVAGTDSLMLLGASNTGYTVKLNSEPAGTFTLNESSPDLQAGDLIMVCDPDHSVVFQLNSFASATITHDTSGSPGNCSKDFSYPTVCSGTSSYVFTPNAQVAKLNAVDWYVGVNPLGGSSLYRIGLENVGGVPTPKPQEMVRDVTAMTLTYHQSGNATFVPASTAGINWALVDAVRVTLTLESVDKKSGTDAKPISRTFTATTTVRNRVL